ncbi:Doubled CXXCH motif (Paired_CXXCH_1) [Rubripirellula lacrimiformis]|uniref:Doubled CXXCH motif (Paired_CXXCH_1) n=1 Tax=Rubripirellula lacrimiformis TaxID=1930273 RepID=A0A517NE48_9BACT|nr:cytochrome c3 family protein [Rubripirellula lacrimiformis]QDT05406.1 Doubled CXXCH motif (Paired_CXXCH_1) [Rubripirellula lacrimiformis]
MPRIANLLFAGVACLAVAMFFVAFNQMAMQDTAYTHHANLDDPAADDSRHVADQKTSHADESESSGDLEVSAVKFPVTIRKPSGPPRIELAGMDPQGRSATVACSTCHANRKPNIENVSAATLDEFHRGMTFKHGTITCYACHNPDGSDSLRMADGTSLEYQDVMTLCSQCHGPQATAFAHGAHGGMNGHWDLTRGPQTKNNCIDCHDPHAPNYPKMIVGFKPKDRFNAPADSDHDHQGADVHDSH